MLSFTELKICYLRRFVAKTSYQVTKTINGKEVIFYWLWITEEEQDNEDNFVFQHPWPLLVPNGYVRFNNQICHILKAKCWAIRLDLDTVALTFKENNPLFVPDYDYSFFKTIFKTEE